MDENLALQLQHLRPAELLELTSFVALLRRGDLKQAQQLLQPLLSPSSRDAFGQMINNNAEKTRCLYALKAVVDHCAARQALTKADHLLSSSIYTKAKTQYSSLDRNTLDERALQQLQFNVTLASMHLNQQAVVDIEQLLQIALTVKDILCKVNFIALMIHLDEYKQARVLLNQLKDVQNVALLDLCRAILFVQQQRFIEAETSLARVRTQINEANTEDSELLEREVQILQAYINKCRVQFVVNVGQQHSNSQIKSPVKKGSTLSPSSLLMLQQQQRPTTAQGPRQQLSSLQVRSPDHATVNNAPLQSVTTLSIDSGLYSNAFTSPPPQSSNFAMMKRYSVGGSVTPHKMDQGPIQEALQRAGVYDRISPTKPTVYTSPSLPPDWLRTSTSPDHAMTVSGPLTKDAVMTESCLQSSAKPLRKSVNRSDNESELRTKALIKKIQLGALSAPTRATDITDDGSEVSPLTYASTSQPENSKPSEVSIMARLVNRSYVAVKPEVKKADDASPRPSIRNENSSYSVTKPNNATENVLSQQKTSMVETSSSMADFRSSKPLKPSLPRNTSPIIDGPKPFTNPAASIQLKPVDVKSPVIEKEAESKCFGQNWRSMLRSLSPLRDRTAAEQQSQVVSPVSIKSVNSYGNGIAKVVTPAPSMNENAGKLSPRMSRAIPLAMLLAPGPYPPNIHVTRREEYLSAEEFAKTFGMTQTMFSKLPRWKQTELKKKVGLF